MIITGPGKERVVKDALREREAQDAQWGGPAHDDQHNADDWGMFIERQTNDVSRTMPDTHNRQRFVKIIALAMAACESIDRKREVGNG